MDILYDNDDNDIDNNDGDGEDNDDNDIDNNDGDGDDNDDNDIENNNDGDGDDNGDNDIDNNHGDGDDSDDNDIDNNNGDGDDNEAGSEEQQQGCWGGNGGRAQQGEVLFAFFLATLVALHLTPVSESVGRWYFRTGTSVVWSLQACFLRTRTDSFHFVSLLEKRQCFLSYFFFKLGDFCFQMSYYYNNKNWRKSGEIIHSVVMASRG